MVMKAEEVVTSSHKAVSAGTWMGLLRTPEAGLRCCCVTEGGLSGHLEMEWRHAGRQWAVT